MSKPAYKCPDCGWETELIGERHHCEYTPPKAESSEQGTVAYVDEGPFTMSRYASREDLYQAMHAHIERLTKANEALEEDLGYTWQDRSQTHAHWNWVEDQNEKLTAENERLRAVLSAFSCDLEYQSDRDKARTALAETGVKRTE